MVFAEHVQTTGLSRLASGEYLVFGRALQINGVSTMAATSVDGLTWTAARGLDPVAGTTLSAAAWLPDVGTVAVGNHVTFDPTTGFALRTTGAVYLRGSDGPWVNVADQASLRGADLRGIIAAGGRFIAFGGLAAEPISSGCNQSSCFGAGIWTSSDGRTWTRVLNRAATFVPNESLTGVVRGSTGLLAFGVRGTTDRTTALWTSPDGRSWTEVHPTGIDRIVLNSVIATPFGYLGVSGFPVPGPTVFTSLDGVHWTATSPSGPSLEGVIAVDDGYVAWSNTMADVDPFVTAGYGVWTSVDGGTWVHVDRYGEFYSGGMVTDGRTVLSIGSNNDPNPIWIGTLTVVPPS